MTEPEDVLLFKGLDLEEPSLRVDRAIFEFARRRLRPPREGTVLSLRSAWLHLGLAAGILLGLALLFPRNRTEIPDIEPGATSLAAPIDAIRELREELGQISEMSELIPPDLDDERAALEEKLRICMASLDALETKILEQNEGSIQEIPRKEVKI